MTNPVTPTPAPVPPSGGGMPKWVIILIIVLLVVILGCCGGIGTCIYFVRRGAQTLKEKAPAWQAEIQRQAQEAQRRAQEQQGGTPAAPGAPETPAAGEPQAGGAAAAPSHNEDNLPSTRLPSNFPSDVPLYSGLTPNYSMADNTKEAGTVMLTGNGNAPDVASWYQKQLSSKGWKEESNQSFNETTALRYTKDNRHVSLTVTPSDGKVTVMIEYGKQ